MAAPTLDAHTSLLETSIELPLDIAEVFAFFAAAENLARITPPELGFRIESPLPIAIAKDTRIDYRLSLFGLPFSWRSLISHWDPPHSFVDEQIKGPYALWHHTHTFTTTPTGTLITDRVLYRLPLWPLGQLALPVVKLQLRRIFSYREQAIARILLGDSEKHPA
jgi:ligand-binding SRPBCC domain-containing protein